MSSFSAGDDEPSAAEWVVVIASVLLTVSLFGFVAVHAVATPGQAPPEVTVVETQTADDERRLVEVEVVNPGSRGLESVTVSVDCSEEPISFQHVPADAHLTGTVVCPAGSDTPTASVENWVWSQGSRSN